MTLFTDMKSDLDAIYTTDEFAETITLDGVEVLAIVGEPAETSEQAVAISNVELTASVRVSEAASVSNRSVAVVRGTTYRVLGDPLNDRLEWQLNLAREMVTL